MQITGEGCRWIWHVQKRCGAWCMSYKRSLTRIQHGSKQDNRQ